MNNSAVTMRLTNTLSTIMLALILGVTLLDFVALNTSFSKETLLYLVIVSIVLSYIRLLSLYGYRRLGFHICILTYTFLCQFGFFIANYIDPISSVSINSSSTMSFRFNELYPRAVELSLVFVLVFVLCATSKLCCMKLDKTYSDNRGYSWNMSNVENVTFSVCLFILSVGTILIINYFRLTRGMGYSNRVRYLSNDKYYGHIMILLSFAFPVILAICRKRQIQIAGAVYFIYIVFQLMMGNRGEVMYALLCCFAIYYLRGYKIDVVKVFAAGFILILLIPIIRLSRINDVLTYGTSISSSIIQTLSELGFQIAPTTYTVELIEIKKVGYRLGGTYLLSFSNFLFHNIPLIDIDLHTDNNVKYMMPQKGLGYSYLAEAYYNFGVIGGAVLVGCVSRVLIRFENYFLSDNLYRRMMIAMVVVEMINLVRNQSGTIPVYLAYSIIYLVLIKIAYAITTKIPNYRLNIKSYID